MFIFRKSILTKISWKTWMEFSWSKQPQREKRMRRTRTTVAASLFPEMGESLILNENKTLNPRTGN